MTTFSRRPLLVLFAVLVSITTLHADENAKPNRANPVYPSALIPFQERGAEVKGFGSKVTDLLFANLVVDPRLFLVDREDLRKVLEEQELSLSGAVNPAQAIKIANLTGAKILITGSVLQVDSKLHVVAKIIGTETSRVLGSSVQGNIRDDLDDLVRSLASDVTKTIAEQADQLVAQPASRDDRLATLKKTLGKAARPHLMIQVSERHVGQRTVDPAAETELTLMSQAAGFDVFDRNQGDKKQVDIIITGEGFSELAIRHGNLVSVKARLELKAVEQKTGRVLFQDRQTAVAVDLSEQIAGKSALQDAAAQLAIRLLPSLVNSGGQESKR